MNTKLLNSAKFYRDNGFNVIAVDKNKIPLFPWRQYQTRFITLEEITKQLHHPNAAGIAIICGAISGNLEVIDIDLKVFQTPEEREAFYKRLCDLVGPEFYKIMHKVQTRSGGFHWYYRVDGSAAKCQKLAYPGLPGSEAVIELKGEGGYVVAPPTPGYKMIFD